MLGVSVLALFAACGSGSQQAAKQPTPTSPPAAQRTAMEQHVVAMCECKTLKCVTAAMTATLNERPEDMRPHQLALAACIAKAQVYAADALVTRLDGLVNSYCACTTAECKANARKQIYAQRSSMPGIEVVLKGMPTGRTAVHEAASKKLARCSDGALSLLPGDQEISSMAAFARRMCECKDDSQCAQDTFKAMMTWVKQHFKGGKKTATKRLIEKWKREQQKLNKCYIQAMKAGLKKKKPLPKPTPKTP